MKTLPETCATTNMLGSPIIIKYGVEGYFEAPGLDIDFYNATVGASEDDVKVMTLGSMFGWDIPAVTGDS